jgi:O-antigen ligase
VALFMTLSRGAVVTLLAGISVVVFVRYRWRGAAVAAVLLVTFLALYPTLVQWRLGDSTGFTAVQALQNLDESDRERAAAVLAGPQIWATAPIFGVGFGHYSFVSAQFSGNLSATAAHNWYVNVLAEEGLVGIVLWLGFVLSVAWVLRGRPLEGRVLGSAVLAAFVVASLFLEPVTSYQTAALPILVIVAVLAADWPSRRAQAESQGP